MNDNPNLSHETVAKVEQLVERVARKAGYTGKENMTYKELLQAKFEQKRAKLERKFNKYRHKLSGKPSNTDFAEEVKAYLQDGLVDLMREGHSEVEALQITMKKFDQAELNEEFDDFIKAMGGFGMEDYQEMAQWYTGKDEAIGLFYAAFTLLGIVLGALGGYLLGHTWINTLIGLGVGLFVGASFGLFTNAIIVLHRGK